LDNKDSFLLSKVSVLSQKKSSYDVNFIINHDAILKKVNKKLINRGVFNKSHWVKILLTNTSKSKTFQYEFVNNYVDSVKVYLVNGKIIEKEFPVNGLAIDNNKEYLTNKYGYTYPVEINQNETKAIYIHAFVNDGPFLLENKLFTKQGFLERKTDIRYKTTLLVLFIGFVSLVMILSLGMFLLSKKYMYLYYLGFIFSVTVNIIGLNSFISQKVIEGYLLFGNNYTEMLSYLQVYFMLLYTNSFLEINKKYPKISKSIRVLAVVNIIIFFVGLYFRKFEMYYSFSFFFSKIILIITVFVLYFFPFYMMFKGNFMARFFVIAYTPLTLFVGYILLRAIGIVNFPQPSWELITFFEILILSLAMVYQYFLLIRENNKYQELIIAQKENQILEIFKVQNKERKRIAQDIHDGILQKIGLLSIKAKEVFKLESGKKEQKEVSFLKDLEESTMELRNISHEIMPSDLEEGISIENSIENLLIDSLPIANITFNFDYFNLDNEISTGIKYTIYRVLQELVNNVIKHSRAKHVDIQVFEIKNHFNLIFEDNGIGFMIDDKPDGIGLTNIKSRVNALNGAIEISAQKNKGTCVTIKLPI
jgi:signal transduction histidine kinase